MLGLIEGRITRGDVADWAMQWVGASDPDVTDRAVWDALNALAGADSPTTDRRYLYGEEDFRAWLSELRSA
jgi:hypothetical protein